MTRATRQYSDLDATFSINPRTKDIAAKYDDNAVRGALRNLIHTKNYDRPFQPQLGCQLHSMLFDNLDVFATSLMEQTIKDAITKFEPRVELLGVSVNAPDNGDRNEVFIEVVYKLRNTNTPNIFTTTFTRVR